MLASASAEAHGEDSAGILAEPGGVSRGLMFGTEFLSLHYSSDAALHPAASGPQNPCCQGTELLSGKTGAGQALVLLVCGLAPVT